MAEFVFYFSSRPSKIQASPAELHRTEIMSVNLAPNSGIYLTVPKQLQLKSTLSTLSRKTSIADDQAPGP